MNYEEALAYIDSYSFLGSRPGLSRIRELCALLGNPQDALRFIHVAGTNGKGSFCAMTAAVLRAAGYRTGLYTSPYILRFNERMSVDGVDIPDEELAELTALVAGLVGEMTDKPTEFEIITAIAFEYFRRHNCQYVVLEVGMGGRLDATNLIAPPVLSVITGIALDHTKILGDTVEKIAAEKAGIIKPGTPVLWGGEDAGAEKVIRETAARVGVPFWAARESEPTDVRCDLDGTTLSLPGHPAVHIPLLGVYQVKNLRTVLCAVDLLRREGLSLPEEAVRAGLSSVRWPGRFEKLSENPLILSDGAHNPQGIAEAVKTVRTYFPGEKVLFLTAVMADKNYPLMIKELSPLAQEVFTFAPTDTPRALPAEAYAREFEKNGVKATPFPSAQSALSAALAVAKKTGRPIFSLGSLYMYADVRAAQKALGR